jgi:ABC-type lipoprotein export system ATPase subunit
MNSRGSEWYKWDLHVHSPDSLVQHYGKGGVDPWESFIEDLEALPSSFRTIGLNDYLFLDGYRKVLDYRKQGRLANLDLVLPVIELRLNHFGGTVGQLSRVNLHVIFSDELDADLIQAQFLNGLKCDATLLPSPAQSEWSSLLTRESLESLGAAVKDSLPEEHRASAGSDLMEGFSNYNVSMQDVLELLEKPHFKHKYFLAVGKAEWADVKWNSQSVAFKKTLVNRPHFVFTATATPATFANSRQALMEAQVNDRLLDCSDAHHLSTSGEPNRIGNSLTWINAVPTFEGLRHAYFEYETRVYIGDEPPKVAAMRAHRTHHLDRIAVQPSPETKPSLRFEADLPLNAGFVAIVGNKGKGKSALTDVVGLMADSHRSEEFSFLNVRRFRSPRQNLAAMHRGSLTWLSGAQVERSLDEEVDPIASERVQYLPQSYLESICNEGPGADDLFTRELGQVIFSHVPEEDRLGATTLQELIAHRTASTQRRIDILRTEIGTTADRIVELENQSQPNVRSSLEAKVREKEAELSAHDAIKPEEVLPANETDGSRSSREAAIEDVRERIVELQAELRSIQSKANDKALLVERSDSLKKEVENLRHQHETFVERVAPIASDLGIEINDVVKLSIDLTPLDELAQRLAEERAAVASRLSPTQDGTPAKLVAEATDELKKLEAELDAPQRKYQNYLTQLAEWRQSREEIVGSSATPETLESYRHKLGQLATVPSRLEEARTLLLTQALQIHEQHLEIAEQLRRVYAPVQRFINEHPIVRDRFNLTFEVTLVVGGLADRLFALIGRQVAGSFAGTDEGSARLSRAVAGTDFNDANSVREFLQALHDDLHHDNREGKGAAPVALESQLRKGATERAVYELIYGLGYLSAEFWLQSDDRPLSQLSPGQRGTLLLLFYLLIDKSPRPIVLDQPEENLDNQTVHELLVPAIAEARRRRQVVAITHNPNLAVVGDADQVIVADLSGDRLQYVSGAIEEPAINKRIVQILEGTWPAFQNRSDKYVPTSVLEAQ